MKPQTSGLGINPLQYTALCQLRPKGTHVAMMIFASIAQINRMHAFSN